MSDKTRKNEDSGYDFESLKADAVLEKEYINELKGILDTELGKRFQDYIEAFNQKARLLLKLAQTDEQLRQARAYFEIADDLKINLIENIKNYKSE